MEPRQILKNVFGYDLFRGGQEPLIEAILRGQDVLGITPTGAGKSLCYQVPALAREGVTLVISPLISLMKDQVGALAQSGVRAAYLNSSLTAAQFRRAMENAWAGEYRILYVAPDPVFYQKLRALRGKLAREQGVPAYVVFTDAALEDMCRRRPESAAQFLEVAGVGQKKLERYGEAFLKVINGGDIP